MNTYNLFALISDKLTSCSADLTMPLYNTLYEVVFLFVSLALLLQLIFENSLFLDSSGENGEPSV